MKQKERIINDVRDLLKFYDLGQFDAQATIESICHHTKPACHNCVYSPSNCQQDENKHCLDGFRKFLETEA